MQSFIQEDGQWTASCDKDKVWVCSSDFQHDACLYITGDFANDAIKFAYAEEIARRLNEWTLTR